MTIALSWVRKIANTEELVFVSDSRLTGGYRWDTAQKVFPLTGLNAVISFAGDTALTLPVIHQIRASCENHAGTQSGATDINVVRDHVLNIINHMRDDIKNADPLLLEGMDRSANFILGGMSFVTGTFSQRVLRYNKSVGAFTAFKPKKPGKGPGFSMCFSGDYYMDFHERLGRLCEQRGINKFNFEPLEVLIDMLNSGNDFPSIGGSPQLVKVYKHRNVLPYAFYWNHSDQRKVHLFGRPFLNYEQTTLPIIDPGNLEITYPLQHIKN
ncbi:MAG: hypothetical protein A2516_03355 [Alphaproteobacteria bacterium RIFOXYD12_FULL_60_8]|nr:MAG: hypothetical protein A2516_03355 [Alphaproteobacteria bacterium RIFOXYD12_FULL_60_8]